MDDEEIIERVKNEETQYFDLLIRRHWEKVIGVAYKFVKNQDDAEDVAQEAFTKAFIHLDKFKQQSAFSTWVHRIALNTAKNHLSNKESKVPKESITTQEIEGKYPDNHSPEEEMHVGQVGDHLDNTISNLPDDLREVFLLSDYELVKQDDIAQRMGLQPGTVKSRLSRARRIVYGKYNRWRY